MFSVLINTLINTRSQSVDPPGYVAVGIKCFRIRKIVQKDNKSGCHFIRIGGCMALVTMPSINMFLNKSSFTHQRLFFRLQF